MPSRRGAGAWPHRGVCLQDKTEILLTEALLRLFDSLVLFKAAQTCQHLRCSRLPVTALALSSDDAVAFSVSKDGGICRLDVETEHR